mmetsp:Transcript_36210/g.64795  ORF Transcript_36210/g.64795 Transcript_36210/m.64795 type:complete len:92 (-) Transcript_36210:100-375(-)
MWVIDGSNGKSCRAWHCSALLPRRQLQFGRVVQKMQKHGGDFPWRRDANTFGHACRTAFPVCIGDDPERNVPSGWRGDSQCYARKQRQPSV